MKSKLFISSLMLLLGLNAHSQSWQSIPLSQFSNTVPWGQFTINQYTNDIWLVRDTKVAVIQSSGNPQYFDYLDLGTLWQGDDLMFAFTPDSVFYLKKTFGLFNFNGFVSTLIDSSLSDYQSISSDLDTVYIALGFPNGFYKYAAGNSQVFYIWYSEIDAKNGFLYGTDGSSVVYSYSTSTNTQVNLTSDPDYLFGIFHDTKFSRHSDTLYVGGKKGISYAYNYDFLDTITPNNTLNMPSSNVLEMEFDHLDGLWAIFGDGNDVPFALAKLEGNTWTNVFDGSNSPIDFTNFLGLEIDTLGNLWVVDNVQLHTLLTPNSPGWLTTYELEKPSSIFSVYPNPSNGTMHLTINPNTTVSTIEITDLSGKLLKSMACTSELELNLEQGQYFICLKDGELTLEVEKIVIE